MGTIYDDPNREAVGLDPAWVEGTGGEGGVPPDSGGLPGTEAETSTSDDLDAMTKDELLAYAAERGISPANASMTKAEIVDSIRAAGG